MAKQLRVEQHGGLGHYEFPLFDVVGGHLFIVAKLEFRSFGPSVFEVFDATGVSLGHGDHMLGSAHPIELRRFVERIVQRAPEAAVVVDWGPLS